MTVKELIEKLLKIEDQNLLVAINHSSQESTGSVSNIWITDQKNCPCDRADNLWVQEDLGQDVKVLIIESC